ncbi:MAG: hypothetical protein HY755_05150 [Nitrospirae bacterium]|nr:hypothetical protein [Nitrospirota bacterium]
MNFYQFLIPRLNGKNIEKDFDYYYRLVREGIAGFIVFGGELEIVRHGIKELQKIAVKPLIIASDLEQGLGQQLEGGTLFPPAMAIAAAIKSSRLSAISNQQIKLLRRTFKAIALEARYAGINTILAPVLDINTNPKNPIISTRAFGEDSETVSFFGCEMIKTLQSNGIVSCGKHFPGHGDTGIDSHIKLPSIRKQLKILEGTELVPFRKSIQQGVKMIMLGHLSVPALDPSGIPVSLSHKAVRYLRDRLGFKGIITTDAMNMGGIGRYSEEKAALMALQAGVDIILHPTDPEKIVSYLSKQNVLFDARRMSIFRKKLPRFPSASMHRFAANKKLSEELTRKALKASGDYKIKGNPLLIILTDDSDESYRTLYAELRLRYQTLRCLRFKTGEDIKLNSFYERREIIVAVFSKTRAWKGGPSNWLRESLKKLGKRARVLISFGSPYLLDEMEGDNIGDCPRFTDRAEQSRRIGTVPVVKINAFWDSDIAQKAVAEALKSHILGNGLPKK